jgi:hypothetical protein
MSSKNLGQMHGCTDARVKKHGGDGFGSRSHSFRRSNLMSFVVLSVCYTGVRVGYSNTAIA